MRNAVAWFQIIYALIIAIGMPLSAYAERDLNVAVVTHSTSTRAEARNVMRRQGWAEAENLRQDDAFWLLSKWPKLATE